MTQMPFLRLWAAAALAVSASVSVTAAPTHPTEAPDVVRKGFSVGPIQLMCRRPNGWKVDFRRETDAAGIEYACVEMVRETPDYPAAFNLSFNFPKRDTVAAWRPWSARTGFGMYWNLDWLPPAGTTEFCRWLPLYACYSSGGRNRITFAASESAEPLTIKAGIREEDNRLYFSFHFYDRQLTKRTRVTAKLRLDARDLFWSDAVAEAADWMTDVSGMKPASVPDAAFAPLYSTWYGFHQDVYQDVIERECAVASKMGMKTIIVDDGWQTDDTNRGYAFCGDWRMSPRRFPDFKAHVARVHKMGMKYLLWYAVPWMGEKSANLAKFRDKVLYHNRTLKAYCLDPRFPEVREFLVSLYVRALQEWDIDGFKLDFIDSFHFSHGDPAVKENYRGRDIRSLIEAVQRLMSDIYTRLSAIKPDVLIEFRQAYIGPSIRLAGNMLRVADCPADMHVNRSGIVNLRLTSGKTAVHADPLEWHPTDTPEAAAKNVLCALFATVQYSMKLASLDARHVEMIAHWSRFGAAHVDALQRGRFRAYHPELAYPLLEGESDAERIFGVYAAETAVSSGPLDKPVYVLNATDASSLIVELPSAATVESYDTYGAKRGRSTVAAGCRRLTVPPSGYLLIRAAAAK